MIVLFDVLGSPEQSGGMRLHATELISAWCDEFPEDLVHVVGPPWTQDVLAKYENVRVHPWANERVWTRWFGQFFVSWLQFRRAGADYAISLSPIVSPLVPAERAICFQHDWRHKKNPHEFPLSQRAYRRFWQLSAGRVKFNACISPKAQMETIAYVPGSRTALIPNGGDHARDWFPQARSGDLGAEVVTFGHHNNKRPEMVLEALSLEPLKGTGARITVLGAKGDYGAQLRKEAEALGVLDRVDFPGFVTDEEYQSIVGGSKVIVLASSDEGYGLPLAEADYLGKAAVVTRDSGVHEIFPNVGVAEPEPRALSVAITIALTTTVPEGRTLPTWRQTAMGLRARLS